MKETDIPKQELLLFKQAVLRHSEYFDVNFVNAKYAKSCSNIIADPFDQNIVKLIKQALIDEKPLSLIRLGDGEVNLLTFSAYPDTPILNYYVAEQSVNKRAHSFNVSKGTLIQLAEMMHQSINNADVLGLLGLWRLKPVTVEHFINNKGINIRGMVGHWRGLDYLMNMGNKTLFNDKIIVSAHCYFSFLEHLDYLFSGLDGLEVLLINNQSKSLVALSNKYPEVRFKTINLPASDRPLIFNEPYFLDETCARLPQNLTGVLVLIGSGPWAEFYCHWVKERGGVGVDLGTGFDLLVGKFTRPIHRKVIQKS